MPWRNRVFGRRALSRLGSRWAWSNYLGAKPRIRLLNEGSSASIVAACRRRSRTFETLFQRLQAAAPQSQRQVWLFPDTFTNYCEPEIGIATVELLQKLGWGVVIRDGNGKDRVRCCGRPLISNGLLNDAVTHVRHNVERLYAWAESGRPIIACEPSCLLTIKDDYPALLRGDERRRAETVASVCHTWEEFIDDALSQSGQHSPFSGSSRPDSRSNALPSTFLVGVGFQLALRANRR